VKSKNRELSVPRKKLVSTKKKKGKEVIMAW